MFLLDYITYLQQETNGPAITITTNNQIPIFNISQLVDSDLVPALPVYVPCVFNLWRKRRRHYDWPLKELIEDVASTEAICVPVSLRESEESNLEWRLCFPQADSKLILGMNNPQIKLYILLKVILKDIVRKKDVGLTSYMIKNTLCWTCEGMPSAYFTPEHLIERLKNSLYFLKQCLENNMLPCYLLPKRNLLIGKIEGHKKFQALEIISFLLNSSGLYLMQSERLCKSMILTYTHPIAALKAMSVRNILEEYLTLVQLKKYRHLQPTKDINLKMSYRVFSDPEFFEGFYTLINTIGLEIILHIFNPRNMDKYEDSVFSLVLV